MPSSHFSKIAVLQSLPPDDKQTGKLLCEDIEMMNICHQHDIKISFHNVQTRPEFLACLSKLQQEAVLGMWPLLHIECHGADDTTGIILADKSFLSWQELKPFLTSINVATQCNLMVILASCYGGYLASIILPTDRAPCWALIGPTDNVYPDELLLNLSGFYTELLSTLDGDNSLKALLSDPLKSGGYIFTTASGFFKLAYEKYLNQNCTPSQYDKRAKTLSRQGKKENWPIRPSKGALKRKFKNTAEQSFEKYFKQFFMIDLYPENKERFALSKAEVKKFKEALNLR
jgi:hypothetical protein